jgi:precorrin-4/cobalt-precorrin-4 C11-methyltransferase
MPSGESLAAYAATGATLAIHLSVHVLDEVAATLIPYYGADGAVAVVVRASWPEQVVIRGTLSTIGAKVRAEKIERTALILVGPALAARDFADSALYDQNYDRRFRPSAEARRGHE